MNTAGIDNPLRFAVIGKEKPGVGSGVNRLF